MYLNFAEEVPIDDLSVHAQVAVIPNEVRNLIREQDSSSSPTPRNDTND